MTTQGESSPASAATVLILDDNHSAKEWDALFAEDAERRAHTDAKPPTFERFAPVCDEPAAALGHLNTAAKAGVYPDLVVIDYKLPSGRYADHEGRIRPALDALGLKFMRLLQQLWPDPGWPDPPALPACVLWSYAYSPGLAYAFVQAGGRYAASRERPNLEFIEMLWAVHLDGLTWEHSYHEPYLKLGPKVAELLPYLEADWPRQSVMNAISGLSEDGFHQRVHRLREAIELGCAAARKGEDPTSRQVEELDRILASYPAMARYAQEHGQIWVPLEHRPDKP